MNCDNVNEVCIMVQFEELKLKLEGLKPEIDDLSDALGLSAIKSEIQQLENRAAEPGFYDDIEPLSELYNLLDSSINEDAPVGLKEGFLIKSGYSKELDELRCYLHKTSIIFLVPKAYRIFLCVLPKYSWSNLWDNADFVFV